MRMVFRTSAITPQVHLLSPYPGQGLVTVGIIGDIEYAGYEVLPGDGVLIAWIHAHVSEDVPEGTILTLTLTNLEDTEGFGPARMRNEISYQGDARFVSIIPQLEGAILKVVGDMSFFRGDSNGDQLVNLSDAVHTLTALFVHQLPIPCQDAADAHDDGDVNLSDAVYTLDFLFAGTVAMPAPFPERGADPTPDTLRCVPAISE